MDPDDFIRDKGLEGFERLRKYDAAEYRMLRARDGLDLTTQDGMTQYALKCCEILKKVSDPIVMENHLRQLALQTGYDREILLRQIGVATHSEAPQTAAICAARYKSARRRCGAGGARAADAVIHRRAPAGNAKGGGFLPQVCAAMRRHGCSAEGLRQAFVETASGCRSAQRALVQALNYAPLPDSHEEKLELAQNEPEHYTQARACAERMAEIEAEIKTADANRKRELYTQNASHIKGFGGLTGRKEWPVLNKSAANMEAVKARISELIESGKSKGVLTYKEIVDSLGDIEMDSEQFDRVLDTLNGLNIEVIKDDAIPDAKLTDEPEPRKRSTYPCPRASPSTIRCACI